PFFGALARQIREVELRLEAHSRRCGFELFDWHGRLHSLEELDLLIRLESHVRLLPVLTASDKTTHPLPLPLAVGDAHVRDLDAEEKGDGSSDLDLVGVARDLEADRVRGFLQPSGLLGDERAADELLRFHHFPPSASTTRDKASLESTTVPWFTT